MAFATPKPRVSEKTASEEATLEQARAQAEQMLDRAYPAFQVAVTDAANDELRSLRNDRSLTQTLTDGFNAYLAGRAPTQDLLDGFMSLKGNDMVYNFAEEKGFGLFSEFIRRKFGLIGGNASEGRK